MIIKSVYYLCVDPEVGGGGVTGDSGPSLKNLKNIRFLCNAGPDPLKNHKYANPAFNVGPSLLSQ